MFSFSLGEIFNLDIILAHLFVTPIAKWYFLSVSLREIRHPQGRHFNQMILPMSNENFISAFKIIRNGIIIKKAASCEAAFEFELKDVLV